MSKFQEGQEVGKATGGHRQSGVCAVCNQDAANTVSSQLLCLNFLFSLNLILSGIH